MCVAWVLGVGCGWVLTDSGCRGSLQPIPICIRTRQRNQRLKTPLRVRANFESDPHTDVRPDSANPPHSNPAPLHDCEG